MKFIPRLLKKDELQKLLDLYKYLNPDDSNLIDDKMLKSMDEILSNQKFFRYYVIEDNNKFITSCCVAIIPNLTRNGRPYAVIENVITHPDYRKKGLGRAIIEEAVKFAVENNCYKAMLLSNRKRKEAHLFYEQLGFDPNDKIGFIKKL